MSVRRFAALFLGMFLLSIPSGVQALPRGEDGARVALAARALDELRVEEAERELVALLARHAEDPDVQFEVGMLRFLRGDYRAAASSCAKGVVLATHLRAREERIELCRLMHATRDLEANWAETRSPDGRFIVRYPPGPDRVLVPYALEVIAAAERAMERELGTHLPGPIRIEIHPSAESLSSVSSLTVEEIERTGTIALSKWDRLMITSPRALVRGYPWADTLGHEFVHMVLSRATRDRAPVWMQEGYARFLERAYRGGTPRVDLDPASAQLLAHAAAEHRLIPFERLHPSIALLPSADDAALAFAQVATFVERFYRRRGSAGLAEVAAAVRAGAEAPDAFSAAARVPFETLEREWRESLDAPAPEVPGASLPQLTFRRGAEPDETREIRVEAARRFVRLGDLLWSRERPLAASAEYQKAFERADSDPVVGSRLARAALAANDFARAATVASTLIETHREHEPLWAALASARAGLSDGPGAYEAAVEAIRLNPFDPAPHCAAAEGASDSRIEARELQFCRELGGD